ncbi:nuclear transcription factor Y subunit B isoform X2 [Dendrobium catenatum]|uniref:nuclear transcription factor Y subunit B isoform X2 n=1 Tax=Dendrobium catenatum TaxID=906689 RepID=UPI0009F29F52|nr:nuclear transcription factor Y subunit B isoform X2 [Dendrobium catenatum]
MLARVSEAAIWDVEVVVSDFFSFAGRRSRGGGSRFLAMASPGDGSRENGEHSPRSNVREQDRFLPVANISRIMKKALPANGKIAKDAKETTQEASEKCQREKRKTINGDDLLSAMATLGFEEYIEPLKLYLQKYREMEGDSKLSTKVADNAGKREATGLQVANQPGTSTQVELKMPNHSSFAHGMTYMQSQFHGGDLSG